MNLTRKTLQGRIWEKCESFFAPNGELDVLKTVGSSGVAIGVAGLTFMFADRAVRGRWLWQRKQTAPVVPNVPQTTVQMSKAAIKHKSKCANLKKRVKKQDCVVTG